MRKIVRSWITPYTTPFSKFSPKKDTRSKNISLLFLSHEIIFIIIVEIGFGKRKIVLAGIHNVNKSDCYGILKIKSTFIME